MKNLLALFLLPLLIACGGSSEPDVVQTDVTSTSALNLPDVADQLIDDGNTLGEMLARIDGVETAEQIRPEIEAMVEEYRALNVKIETMDTPSFSDVTAMASRAPQLMAAQKQIANEIQRIETDHPDAAEVLRKALADLGQ
jgi:hypothetical protein